jgi:hypothetical protein
LVATATAGKIPLTKKEMTKDMIKGQMHHL